MTKSIKIAGVEYILGASYAEGDIINANEASALNQTRAENIRNNFSNVVKKALSVDGGEAPSQGELDAYAAAYKFGVRASGGGRDPVKSEMKIIATKAVMKKLVEVGITKEELGKDVFNAKVAEVLVSNAAFLLTQAEIVIAARAADVLVDFKI